MSTLVPYLLRRPIPKHCAPILGLLIFFNFSTIFGARFPFPSTKAFMTASQVTQREWHQPGNYSEAALKRNENK